MSFGNLPFGDLVFATNESISEQEVYSDLTITWDIESPVFNDLTISWGIEQSIIVDLPITWDIDAGITVDLIISWDIENAVTADLDISWYTQGLSVPLVKGNEYCVPKQKRSREFCL